MDTPGIRVLLENTIVFIQCLEMSLFYYCFKHNYRVIGTMFLCIFLIDIFVFDWNITGNESWISRFFLFGWLNKLNKKYLSSFLQKIVNNLPTNMKYYEQL